MKVKGCQVRIGNLLVSVKFYIFFGAWKTSRWLDVDVFILVWTLLCLYWLHTVSVVIKVYKVLSSSPLKTTILAKL